MGPLTLNVIRTLSAALFICVLIPFSGATGELRAVSAATVVAMVGSGILAIGLGDSLFFASLPILGVSLAVPISSSVYPLLTFLIASIWLGETVTWAVLLGSLLIILGIFLLLWRATPTVTPPAGDRGGGRLDWRAGVLLLMAATLFWTLSTTWLRAGSGNLGPVSAGALRVGATTLFLLPSTWSLRQGKGTSRFTVSSVASVAAAGILAVGIGGLFYIAAVEEVGAGRTAILTSTMPLFNLPLAVLFLRERVTPRVVAGTVTCVAGIWLII